MLTRTSIALAAALIVGAASAALAADDKENTGGYRELGSGRNVTDGVNPVDHPSISGAPRQAQPRLQGRSDGSTEGLSAVERAERRDNTEDDKTGAKDR